MGAWWRAGCPQALSVRAWVVTLPAWLAMALAVALARGADESGVRVVLALCGFLVAGLIVIAGSSVAPHGRAVTRRTVVVVSWTTAGVVAVGVSWVLARMAGLQTPDVTIAIPVLGAVVVVIWFPLGGRLAHEVMADARSRADLLRQLARERALALESARVVEADRARVVAQTQQVVEEQLRKAVDLSADPASAAAALQEVVDEVVRPLSRELEEGEVEEQALVEAVHTMGAVTARDLRDFLPELRRPPLGTVAITFLRILVAIAIVISVTRGMLATPAWLVVGLLAIYAVVMAAILTLAQARSRSSEHDLSQAIEAAEWASSRLRQLAWSERERLGRVIHGDAQARIVATALQIQLGGHDDIAERVGALRTEIQAVLSDDQIDRDWREVWERILTVWEYAVEVDTSFDPAVCPALDTDPVAAHAVVSVLREAVTNAMRHAHATHLDLDLSVEHADVLRFVIADNGTSGATRGEPGLGSRTMDAVCLDWQLSTTAVGHTLIARIPVGSAAHV